MIELPGPVADLSAVLGAVGGVEAVAMGGSRATGTAAGRGQDLMSAISVEHLSCWWGPTRAVDDVMRAGIR